MKYTHIIWDFNGTILDDVQSSITSVNTLLARRNLKTLDTLEEYHKIFTFPISDYYLAAGFDFDKDSYNDLALEWVEEYINNAKNSTIHSGLLEVLKHFKSKNLAQIVLSATEKDMLITQLQDLGIINYFDTILGLNNIYAHSKKEIGQAWKSENPEAKALVIGDTSHDFEVATTLGFDCILIAKGHQNKATLSKLNCPVLEDINQLNQYL